MNFFFLLVLAGVLLLWGAFSILRGLKNNDDQGVVPISDVKELEMYKKKMTSSSQPSVDPITSHILKQNLGETIATITKERTQELDKSMTNLQEKVEALTKENVYIKEAFEREVTNKKGLLSEQVEDFAQTKSELTRLKDANERLTTENLRLEKLWDEDKNRIVQAEKIVHQLREELQKAISDDRLKLQSLEEKILMANKDQEAMSNHKLVLDRLSAENQDLLFQVKEKEAMAKRLAEEKSKLASEYEYKLHQMDVRLTGMQNKLVKEDHQLLLTKLHDTHENLRKLASENEKLAAANAQLGDELANLKSIYEVMLEREKFLQYELTKSRAQLVGLERLCEDFKLQLDATAKS